MGRDALQGKEIGLLTTMYGAFEEFLDGSEIVLEACSIESNGLRSNLNMDSTLFI